MFKYYKDLRRLLFILVVLVPPCGVFLWIAVSIVRMMFLTDRSVYWRKCLETETNMLGKVHAHWYLADTCLHFGESDRTLESLNFVLQNGGDTIYRGWAEKREIHQRRSI